MIQVGEVYPQADGKMKKTIQATSCLDCSSILFLQVISKILFRHCEEGVRADEAISHSVFMDNFVWDCFASLATLAPARSAGVTVLRVF